MFRRLKQFVTYSLLTSSILYAAPSQAGLIWFSRANCANNESITWDWPGNNYWLFTKSYHYKNGYWRPTISTGWQYGFRSSAVDWGAGFAGGAYVVGDHWQWIAYYGSKYLGRTQTNNCNLGYFFPYW